MNASHNKLLLVRAARVVQPSAVLESTDVLTRSGVITQIGNAPNADLDGASVIDLSGLTLFPGFIDIHIHGAAGVDTMGANSDELVSVGEFLARNGVTAWLPTLVPTPAEEYER